MARPPSASTISTSSRRYPSSWYRQRDVTAELVMGDSKNIITPGAILGRCEPAIRLHVVAGHNLIGFRDEAIELLLVPYKIRALHSAGIAVVRKRTGSPSDNIVEVRAQAIVAFLWSYGRRCLEGTRSRKNPQTLRPYPKSHIRQGADRSADA